MVKNGILSSMVDPKSLKRLSMPNVTYIPGVGALKKHRAAELAHIIRECADPRMFWDTISGVLQGYDPIWVVDPETGEQYVAARTQNAEVPTLEFRMKMLEWAVNRAYGLPVQQVQLEATLRSNADDGPAVTLTFEEMQEFMALNERIQKRRELGSAVNTDDAPRPAEAITDAEFTETKTETPDE